MFDFLNADGLWFDGGTCDHRWAEFPNGDTMVFVCRKCLAKTTQELAVLSHYIGMPLLLTNNPFMDKSVGEELIIGLLTLEDFPGEMPSV